MSDAAGVFDLRLMESDDIDDVLVIERRSFPTPWSLAMFVLELAKPSSVCLCAFEKGTLVGYLVAAKYAHIWHVMNVSVDPSHRRKNIATLLLRDLFEKTVDRDGRPVHYTLEVRVSNEAAIAMYRRNGFKAAGVRTNYYADNREDALIMWRSTDENFIPPNTPVAEWENQ